MAALEGIQQTPRDNDPSAKRKRDDTKSISASKRTRLGDSLNVSSNDDFKTLQAVESKYDVQIHSVISASKIQKKVTSVLQHLTSTPNAQTTRVSVLRARASDAGKLVSIAEIARRELGKREGDERIWFQYILH